MKQDEFDDGYRPLVISSEVDHSDPKQPSESETTQRQHYETASLTTVAKTTPTTINDDSATATKLSNHHHQRMVLNTLHHKPDSNRIESETTSVNSVTDTPIHLPVPEKPFSGYTSNSDSIETTMTLGQMECQSDDSSDYGAGKLVISPAIYRGQNTPIPKPRQPTPSKTRRKSDKVSEEILKNYFVLSIGFYILMNVN